MRARPRPICQTSSEVISQMRKASRLWHSIWPRRFLIVRPRQLSYRAFET